MDGDEDSTVAKSIRKFCVPALGAARHVITLAMREPGGALWPKLFTRIVHAVDVAAAKEAGAGRISNAKTDAARGEAY